MLVGEVRVNVTADEIRLESATGLGNALVRETGGSQVMLVAGGVLRAVPILSAARTRQMNLATRGSTEGARPTPLRANGSRYRRRARGASEGYRGVDRLKRPQFGDTETPLRRGLFWSRLITETHVAAQIGLHGRADRERQRSPNNVVAVEVAIASKQYPSLLFPVPNPVQLGTRLSRMVFPRPSTAIAVLELQPNTLPNT